MIIVVWQGCVIYNARSDKRLGQCKRKNKVETDLPIKRRNENRSKTFSKSDIKE